MSCNIRTKTLDYFRDNDLITENRTVNVEKYDDFIEENQRLTKYAFEQKNVVMGDLFSIEPKENKDLKGNSFTVFRVIPNDDAFDAIQAFNDNNPEALFKETLFDNIEFGNTNVLDLNTKQIALLDSTDTKTLDKINEVIFDNKTTGLKAVDVINNIINNISSFNEDTQSLLNNLKLLVENTDSKVKFIENPTWRNSKIMGFNAETNSIEIGRNRLDSESLDDVASAILHEAVHSTVSYMLRNKQLANSLDTKIARNKIQALYNFYKYNSNNSESEGFRNLHEFVAEAFSNVEFQNELKQIEMNSTSEYMTKGKNVWEHFVDFVRSVLGLNPKFNQLIDNITTLVKDELPEEYLRDEGYYFKTSINRDNYKYEQKLNKLYNQLKNNIQTQLNRANYYKGDSKAFKKYKAELKKLENNLKIYEEVDKLQGVMSYLDSVEAQIESLKKRFSKDDAGEDVDLELLIKNFNNYELLYSTIDEVQEVARSYKREIGEKEYLFNDPLLSRINAIKNEYETIAEQKLYLQQKLLLQELGKPKYFPKIEAKYREIYKKEHKNINNNETLENYISRKMFANREQIEEEALTQAKKMFNNNKFDISAFEQLMLSGMEINSGIIQLFEKLLSENRDYINQELLKVDKEISALDDVLRNYKKSDNVKKIFGNLVETDENGKLYLKGEYKIEYLKKSHQLDLLNAEIADVSERINNGEELVDEYESLIKKRANLAKSLFTKVKNEKGVKVKVPRDKWKNNLSNLSKAEKTSLDYFKAQTKTNNKLTFSRSSLIETVHGATFYQVPRVPATDLQRILSGDGTGLVRDKIQRLYKYKNDEFDFDQIAEEEKENVEVKGKKIKGVYKKGDIKGNLIRDIPLHYRGDIDPKDQSYDLSTIFKLEALNAISYNKKRKSEQLITSFVDIIKQTGTVNVNNSFSKTAFLNFFTKKNSDVDEPLTKKEKDLTSNTVKKLDGLLESHFYDITKTGSIKIGNVDINKIVGYLNGWTGAIGMSLNHHSAFANLTGGYLQVLQHALSNDIINRKSLMKAINKYHSNTPDMVKDLNNNYDEAFVNQILNKFNVFGGYNIGTKDYSDNRIWKKFLKTHSLQFMQDMGEHQLQAVVAMAVLDSVKGLDSNGNEIDGGKSILDLLKKDKNGDLKIDDKLEYTTYSRFAKWDEGGRTQLTDMIKFKIFNVFGNYDSNLQPEIMKLPLGRLFMMYRRFFFPMFMNRYRGATNALQQTEDIDLDKRFFSYANQRFEEGFYVTTIRYARHGIIPAIKRLKFEIAKAEWDNLTDYEKSNIRKAVIEQGMSVITSIAAGLLAGAADEDDNELLWFFAWWSERMSSELDQFLDPREFQRIMRSPFASLRTLDNTLNFWSTLVSPWSWLDEYESGPREGESKFIRAIQKQVPIWSRWDIKNQDKYNFLDKGMFGN